MPLFQRRARAPPAQVYYRPSTMDRLKNMFSGGGSSRYPRQHPTHHTHGAAVPAAAVPDNGVGVGAGPGSRTTRHGGGLFSRRPRQYRQHHQQPAIATTTTTTTYVPPRSRNPFSRRSRHAATTAAPVAAVGGGGGGGYGQQYSQQPPVAAAEYAPTRGGYAAAAPPPPRARPMSQLANLFSSKRHPDHAYAGEQAYAEPVQPVQPVQQVPVRRHRHGLHL